VPDFHFESNLQGAIFFENWRRKIFPVKRTSAIGIDVPGVA
jgi:hypothetical protein